MRIPLLMLPGMDGTGRLFAGLMTRLPGAIEGRVIAYPPDLALDYEQLLARVRPLCPTNGDWYVLGESFSGPLALRLAADRPPGLRGVILAASFVAPPVRWLPPWLVRPGLLTIGRGLAGRVLGTGDGPRGLHAAFVAASASVAADVLVCRARAILGVDLRAFAARLAGVPVLALVGQRDRVLGRGHVAAIEELLPHVLVRRFDAPHLLLQTRPDEAAAAISAFMRCGES